MVSSTPEVIVGKSVDREGEDDNKSFTTTYSFDDDVDSNTRLYCVSSIVTLWWNKSFGKIGGDWIFLTLLGILMSATALFVDYGIQVCTKARTYLFRDMTSIPSLQYLGWIWLPLCLILFSTSFTRLLAPQAAGSGIPEMKTILLGIIPKKSFTCKALIAKIIGLTAALGTGLPLGKEGPFVHIASMTVILLSKATTPFRSILENKLRHKDMLAAACAVGVAMAFAAPIGGVLFSIEVTAVHFAVRNYWRGFFAALCATVLNRFIAVWFYEEATITAIHVTTYFFATPYSPGEIIVFSIIGVVCGFFGALFVWVHRKFVTFKNNNRLMIALSQKSVLLYPFLVTLLYTSLTFPHGLGMFVAGELTTSMQIDEMFSNFSWTKENPSSQEYSIISNWQSPYTGIFANLSIYVIFTFLGTILASTIPVPAGIFVPVFKMGAAIGRITGEMMYLLFPHERYHGISVIPGGYSVVGAAALAGAVTHTVSSSVIAFELTGQMTFGLPVMVAVFIANGVAQALQPSIFDSIIKMRKLPYLPKMPSMNTKAYDIFVEDFMVWDVKFIWYGITYDKLKQILTENRKIQTFPIVDSADSMVLLGSANRRELISLIEENIGTRKKTIRRQEWREEAERAVNEALKIDELKQCWAQIGDNPDISFPVLLDESYQPTIDSMKQTSPKTPERAEHENTVSVTLSDDHSTPHDESEEPVFNKERRPSRFSVTKVEGPLIKITTDEESQKKIEEENNLHTSPESTLGSELLQPQKGILKKTNSFTYDSRKSPISLAGYVCSTLHVEEVRRKKNSFSGLSRAKSLLGLDTKTPHYSTGLSKADFAMHIFLKKMKEMEAHFEEKEMKRPVDFSVCQINPAPHQLVERSNLLQVHSVFSLLGLQYSYVTAIGRLIGVVGLKELREVIERVNSGEFAIRGRNIRKFSLGFLSLR